ncbi:YqgE/AlgH family protein [Skeletonema marinoi]|uniref:YqgE/AlgH family protein n=1 Tax=Skeletonema marinoi TaxID=267567 RepID=A0AAD9DAW9_9STRA|nr:YqgE/AlgH family protein [Skeletonema marinoi]
MTTPPPFVIRSVYRSLLRSSKPFSPPSPNYAVYASLLHRSGISHDWEECIYDLEKKRAKLRSRDGDDSNGKKKKNENIIPKSWARNLTRSYADLKEEYQMHKDSLASLHDDDDDDDDEEDDDWDEDVPIGSHHFHEQEYYNADQDPKFILFRHLLREWFAGGNDTTKDEAIDNSWPRQWSPDEEGYYENGKIKQVPLMRFPSQIIGDCDGLSVREIIQREFRAVTVEEKYERERCAKANDTSSSTSAAAVGAQIEVYPPSSYIDNPIRLQTALYTLQELNRKLLWANKIGLPNPNDCTTRQAREWKRLVQAAKGVSVYPKEDEKCATANEDPPLETETVETKIIDDADSTQSNDEPSTPKEDKKSAHPLLDCGTLMIAHPLMTGYFANSVIILLDHTDVRSKDKSDDKKSSSTTTTDEAKSSGGTYGLIVNRLALEANSVESTQSRLEILRQRFEEKKERDLAEVLLQSSDATETSATGPQKTDVVTTKSTGGSARRPISLLQAVQNDDLPETVQLAFGDAPIREGGPVNLSIQMIHRAVVQNDLGAGATKEKSKKIGGTVIPSHFGDENLKEMETTFFGGDVINASYAVLEGVRDADDFSFIIGASCWSPGQLENEIQRGCWLRFCGPSSMAMTGMCDHYDAAELKQLFGSQDEEDKDSAQGAKLSSFPPRPSNAATLSVAGSATRGSNNTQQSGERPVGDLWLSIMCALSQGEADLAYVMLNSSHVKDDLGDACDNFYK